MTKKTLANKIDDFGSLNDRIKILTEEAERLKADIKDEIEKRMEDGNDDASYFGREYQVTYYLAVRTKLDGEKVKKMLSPAKYNQCLKTSNSAGLRVTAMPSDEE